jgi:TPR repeat protein
MRLTSKSLKKTAKKIKKEKNIKHLDALNLVAQKHNFADWQTFVKAESFRNRISIISEEDRLLFKFLCEHNDCDTVVNYIDQLYMFDNEYVSQERVTAELLEHATDLRDQRQYIFAKYIYLRLELIQNSEAIFQLGVMHEQGFCFPRNSNIALEYYRKADVLNNLGAKLQLAKMHLYGHLVEKNVELGLNVIKELAQQQFPAAITVLASFYHAGFESIQVSHTKAWMLYAQASTQNDSDALYGMYYLLTNEGSYKGSDPKLASTCLDLAATLGHDRAQGELVNHYVTNNQIDRAKEIVYDGIFNPRPKVALARYYLSKLDLLSAKPLLKAAFSDNDDHEAKLLLKKWWNLSIIRNEIAQEMEHILIN